MPIHRLDARRGFVSQREHSCSVNGTVNARTIWESNMDIDNRFQPPMQRAARGGDRYLLSVGGGGDSGVRIRIEPEDETE